MVDLQILFDKWERLGYDIDDVEEALAEYYDSSSQEIYK